MPTETPFIHRPAALRLALGLILVGLFLNILFLFNHCPFQLSDDEAHYWEWSRHLDYGYYSKPPGIAWLLDAWLKFTGWLGADINAPGQTLMPLVRLPAVFFSTLSGLLSLSLARRIFRDDRAALAVTLLSAAVPMFAIGSLLITIDSPMYLCWAASIYCLWRQVESAPIKNQKSGIKNSAWLYAAALACSAGMLFKPVLIAIPICAAIAAYIDPQIRRALRSVHSLAAILIVLASQIPTIIWNAHHNWVTFRHISAQGGLTTKPKSLLVPLAHVGEYIGGQAAGMAGLVFILLVIAVILALKLRRNPPAKLTTEYAGLKTQDSGLSFLLAFTLPLWLFYLALSLWKGTEINWPAASYFSGMILLGGIFAAGWNSAVSATRRWWRTLGTVSIACGILATAIALNLHRFYPLYPALAKEDPAAIKLRGFEERAALVQTAREKLLAETGQDPMIIANTYGPASSLSFYLPDHPMGGEKVFCLMSSMGGRHNQYDIWPGPNQKTRDGKLAFAGRPAIIIGIDPSDPAVDKLLKPAFERLEGPDFITPTTNGIPLRTITLYRGYNFKGFPNVPGDTW